MVALSRGEIQGQAKTSIKPKEMQIHFVYH